MFFVPFSDDQNVQKLLNFSQEFSVFANPGSAWRPCLDERWGRFAMRTPEVLMLHWLSNSHRAIGGDWTSLSSCCRTRGASGATETVERQRPAWKLCIEVMRLPSLSFAQPSDWSTPPWHNSCFQCHPNRFSHSSLVSRSLARDQANITCKDKI